MIARTFAAGGVDHGGEARSPDRVGGGGRTRGCTRAAAACAGCREGHSPSRCRPRGDRGRGGGGGGFRGGGFGGGRRGQAPGATDQAQTDQPQGGPDAARIKEQQRRVRQAEMARLVLVWLLTADGPVTWIGTAESPE